MKTNIIPLRAQIPEPKPRVEPKALTTARIGSIPVTGKRQRIADGKVPGLYLVVTPAGAKSFIVRSRVGRGRGRPVVDITIGPVDKLSLAEARARATAIISQMLAGEDPRQQVFDEVSVGALIDQFLERQRRRGITRLDNQTLQLTRLVTGLRQQPAHTVTKAQWAAAIDRVYKRYGIGPANDALKFGKAMMNWADGAGIVEQSQLLRVPAQEPTRADRIAAAEREQAEWTLRRRDWAEFWRAAEAAPDPIYTAFLRVLALTGQRRTETSLACWDHIDFEAGIWHIPAANRKTATGHDVYLGPLTTKLLRDLPRLGDLVFPGRGGVPMSGWSKRIRPVAAAMGVSVQLHGLRRGFRTALTELHVNRDTAELMVGHARRGLEKVYDKAEMIADRQAAQHRLEAAWAEVIR